MLNLRLNVKFIMNILFFFLAKAKFVRIMFLERLNFIIIGKKFIINLTLKLRFSMRNDRHFGQLRIFNKKSLHNWMERVALHKDPRFF